MPPSGKKLAILLVVLCLAAVACMALYYRYVPASAARPETARRTADDHIDLTRPDALIRSSSLTKLPRDLLRIPAAKDVFTEDIVNYYEHHEGKLALSGTLRRIAYENKLPLPERLIEMALDGPVEAALWNDGRGRLRHFAVAMTQNTLARAVTLLLPLHTQVTSAGQWPDMDAAVLVLSYSHQRLTLFTRDDRVVAVSEGLLPEARAAADGFSGQQQKVANLVNTLLAEKDGQPSALAGSFHLAGGLPEKGHEIVLAAKALAFGYEHFMPELGAFRFVFDETGGWQSDVLLNGKASTAQYAPLWHALPHGAALCAALPVDWAALAEVARQWREQSGKADEARRIGDMLAKFDGPAAVCWYGDSHLYTPLFAASCQKTLSTTEKEEFLYLSRTATKVTKPDESLSGTEGGMWRGRIPSAYGTRAEEERPGKRFLHPAAAIWPFTVGQGAARDVAFFSPDAALVQKALEVGAKKFPALADNASTPDGDQMIAFINPGILAELMRRELFDSTPKNEADNFLDVADFLFTPRFQALARYTPQTVSFRAGKHFFGFSSPGWQWYPLRWNNAGNASAGTAGEAFRP